MRIDQFGVWLEAFRAGDIKLEIELVGCIDVGVAHIIAITYPRNRLAGYACAMFDIGLYVGEQLARMKVIGKRVDDRYARNTLQSALVLHAQMYVWQRNPPCQQTRERYLREARLYQVVSLHWQETQQNHRVGSWLLRTRA